jgi:transcriptional regulator with XRE-family HTH domain
MREQLLKILESENLTPAKFADEIGVQRSSISHILNGRNKPSYDFILKIMNRFAGINAEWLITGKGQMIKSESVIAKQSSQQDLFTANYRVVEKMNNSEIIESEKIKNTKANNVKSLISKNSEENENKKIVDLVTNVNNLKFIIIFYKDGTFDRFNYRE